MSDATVDNICKKQTIQSVEKADLHIHKNKPIGIQNRPWANHETIPQPKLKLLKSCQPQSPTSAEPNDRRIRGINPNLIGPLSFESLLFSDWGRKMSLEVLKVRGLVVWAVLNSRIHPPYLKLKKVFLSFRLFVKVMATIDHAKRVVSFLHIFLLK